VVHAWFRFYCFLAAFFAKVSDVQIRVVAVANQKGGVGKTTTAVNLAACAAAVGRRVLLFDLDPQANATSGVGLEKTEGASAYRPLLGEGTLLEKIKDTAFERLQIIPSEVDLCGVEIELARSENHLLKVSAALQPVLESNRFDIILIDCPPSLGVLTLNAFSAAERSGLRVSARLSAASALEKCAVVSPPTYLPIMCSMRPTPAQAGA